jgi:hypothetical protein
MLNFFDALASSDCHPSTLQITSKIPYLSSHGLPYALVYLKKSGDCEPHNLIEELELLRLQAKATIIEKHGCAVVASLPNEEKQRWVSTHLLKAQPGCSDVGGLVTGLERASGTPLFNLFISKKPDLTIACIPLLLKAQDIALGNRPV